MTTDLHDDKRTIKSIGSVTRPEEWGWQVGTIAGSVTKIESYFESGQMAGVPWFAVYVGDEIRWRVPATDMVVEYAKAVPE